MACPDDQTLVLFADSELDASQRAMVEQHLAGCASCRGFVDEMRSLTAVGRSSLRTIDVPARPHAAPILLRRVSAGRVLAIGSVAAAASVLIVLSLVWVVTEQAEVPDQAAARADPVPTEVAQRPSVTPLANDAFERWAAPYRELRIPLVPMEDVPKYVSNFSLSDPLWAEGDPGS